jgi:RNA polymerase sigma-70 factor (ECF subfamily)
MKAPDLLQSRSAQDAGVTDAELLDLLREVRPTGHELVMRRYNRLLFRAARSILTDDARAEAAVVDAYLYAFGRVHAVPKDCGLSTWLLRIVIHEARRRARG